MSIFESREGKGHFEFDKTDFCDANGSKTIEFQIRVKADGFAGDLSGVWFYKEDLAKFAVDIGHLISGRSAAANLRAMSEFSMDIVPVDGSGHFAVKFSLKSSRGENSANLTVIVETQQLLDLAGELGLP